ncbi:MAG: hypothetical protein JXQ87_10160 [Bacteroidia bacterium]
MIKTHVKWVIYALLVGSMSGCLSKQSTKIIDLSTIKSTDTVKAGTPKGMYLYLNKDQALNLNDLLAEKGFGITELKQLNVKEIRIKVEIPENNFNPNTIESFNTSFTQKGNQNTVIESDELAYTERTYIIKVQDGLSTLGNIDDIFDLNGGLRLREALEQDVVLTTSVVLEAEVSAN